MTKTVPAPRLESTVPRGTAAPAYHLSESLDRLSLSTQMKNRVVLVPVHTQTLTILKWVRPLIAEVNRLKER